MTNVLFSILKKVSALGVVLFVALGVLLVGAQLVGLICQNGALMKSASALLLKPACTCAAITGVMCFALQYEKEKKV